MQCFHSWKEKEQSSCNHREDITQYGDPVARHVLAIIQLGHYENLERLDSSKQPENVLLFSISHQSRSIHHSRMAVSRRVRALWDHGESSTALLLENMTAIVFQRASK